MRWDVGAMARSIASKAPQVLGELCAVWAVTLLHQEGGKALLAAIQQ